VFPVRYGLDLYILFRRYSVFKGLIDDTFEGMYKNFIIVFTLPQTATEALFQGLLPAFDSRSVGQEVRISAEAKDSLPSEALLDPVTSTPAVML
jgi:hypothetical protein